MKFKVGDKVRVDITKEELLSILKNNKDIAYQIMQCYMILETEIIEIDDNMIYLKVDNGRTAWYENELKLIKDDILW